MVIQLIKNKLNSQAENISTNLNWQKFI